MTRADRDGRRKPKPRQRQRIRLLLEELEGRCLLSHGAITVDPSGNLWFEGGAGIEELNPSTAIIQQFSLPPGTGPGAGMLGEIALDQAGNVWFSRYDRIDELNPNTGAVQEFLLPFGGLTGMGVNITVAPDGNIWFPFWDQHGPCLGKLDPQTGLIKEEVVFPGGTILGDIAASADGKIWFTEWTYPSGNNALGLRATYSPEIGAMDPQTGAIQEFAPMGDGPAGVALAVGPNGLIWFATQFSEGTIDPATGEMKEFNLPNGHWNNELMTVAPDGNIWFIGYKGAAEYELDELDSSTGLVKVVSDLPASALGPFGITATPDGNLWIVHVDLTADTITQFNPNTGTFQFFEPAPPGTNQGTSNSTASNNSLSATGKNVSALAGINFLTAVASFTPQAPIASPGQAYQATVDWGDGTTSSIVLSVTASGTYDVVASHAYQTAGTYTMKVTIGTFDPANPLGDNAITVFGTATVDPFDMNMGL